MDFEKLYHSDPSVNKEAINELLTFALRANKNIEPRGNATEVAPSLLPPGSATRIEQKLSILSHNLQRSYIYVLGAVGGSEEVTLAKKIITEILAKGTSPEREDLDKLQDALHILGHIGGVDAFQTLLTLRSHPDSTIQWWADVEARGLFVHGTPHDDVGHGGQPSTEEIKRMGIWRQEYEKSPT